MFYMSKRNIYIHGFLLLLWLSFLLSPWTSASTTRDNILALLLMIWAIGGSIHLINHVAKTEKLEDNKFTRFLTAVSTVNATTMVLLMASVSLSAVVIDTFLANTQIGSTTTAMLTRKNCELYFRNAVAIVPTHDNAMCVQWSVPKQHHALEAKFKDAQKDTLPPVGAKVPVQVTATNSLFGKDAFVKLTYQPKD